MIHLERYDRIDPARVLWSILHFPELYEEWGAIYEMYRAPVGTFEDYMANGLDVLRAGGGDERFIRDAWIRLDRNRKGRRWKARFRKNYPFTAHTLERLEAA